MARYLPITQQPHRNNFTMETLLRRGNSIKNSSDKTAPLIHLFASSPPISTTHSSSPSLLPSPSLNQPTNPPPRNRALSIRSGGKSSNTSSSSHHHFSFTSLRSSTQPELSRKLHRLIKTENALISAYISASRERVSLGTQLSEWGEATNDAEISDISDKLGVLLSELGEQEDLYAHNLDDSRGILKAIRNTEKSVQPSRDHKQKLMDEIAKLKVKEPESARLVTLEQELVRAEAENLVAEAQLSNVTRKKMKEAYNAEFLATIERAEKQILLANHGRRILHLLDDTPIVPGHARPEYAHAEAARGVLNDAEDDLREWQLDLEDVEEWNRRAGVGEVGQGVGEGHVGEGGLVGGHAGEARSAVAVGGSEEGSRVSSGGTGTGLDAGHVQSESQNVPGSYTPSAAGTSVTTGQMGGYATSEAGTTQVASMS
ncbi:Sphingolipid long chain base-responsive LSP1 protein [Rutstroemia sp. NJR-2017a BVV2]|nr:Sphingolipid long chain base-responsive LSP1 protein [Rutstroemia sp. NJR-2017a BVV2]